MKRLNRFDQTFLKYRVVLLVAAITLLALLLRVINLGYSDLTFDETASYFVSSKPLGEMLPYLLSAFHEHPPVYFVTLAGWMQLMGKGEAALRLWSVFCGVLSVPLMYQFGRKAINARAGVVAALLLAIAPVHIAYSQTARMYTLLGALALLAWWLVLKLETSDQKRYFLALSACSLIGLATHYYMGLVIASQAAYWLLAGKRQRRLLLQWLLWLAVPLIAAALYLFTSPGGQATVRMLLHRGLGASLSAGPWRGLAAELLLGPHGNTLGIAGWGLPLIGVVLGVGLALSKRAGVRREMGVLLLCAIGVPIGLMLVLPEAISARYVIFVLFPIVLAWTIVIVWPLSWTGRNLNRRRWVPAVSMLLALVALDMTRLPYQYTALNSTYGRLLEDVRANLRSGDGVVFNGPWQAIMQAYYPVGDVPAIYLPPQTPPALDPVTAEPALRQFVQPHSRIWVLPVAIEQADPDHFVQRWLNEHWHRTSDSEEAILYYAPPAASLPVLSEPVHFGNSIELQAAAVATTTIEAGSAVLSTLAWRALQPPYRDIQITLAAVDQSGFVRGQRIYQPGERFATAGEWNAGKTIVDRQAIPIDPGAPPGEYWLRVSAQRASTGESLPLEGGADPLQAALTPLQVIAPRDPIDPARLPGQQVAVRFDNRLELSTIALPSGEFMQGGMIPLTFYWRALPGDRDVDVDIALVDRNGNSIDMARGPLGPEWYRAGQWTPGQVVATSAPLSVPPHLPAGTYQLQVTVRDRNGQPIPATGTAPRDGFLGLGTEQVPLVQSTWTITDVAIVARERNFNMPAVQQPSGIRFGDRIQLLGYDVDAADARSGGRLRVTFYWKALQPGDQNYVVFTHLVDSAGVQRGQRDSMPLGGLNPTPWWEAGEIIADTYNIDIDSAAPAGPYTLDFGWYQSDTAERLPAVDASGARLRDDIAQISGITVLP